MKNAICLLLICICTSALFAEPIAVKSKIEAVTVYRSGAEVVNVATVDVPAGESKIVFEEISNNVNASSVQVAGTQGITLLSAIYKMNYLKKQEKTPQIIRMEDSIQVLNLELTKLAARKAVFLEEEAMLGANQAIGGANTGVSVTELQKAVDFMHTRLLLVKAEIIDLEQDEKKVNDRINKVRNQLNEFNQQTNRPFGEVELAVTAKNATRVSLRISYFVSSAGWTPVYDLRAGKLDAPVSVTYKANVQQNTGVSWEKVKLTLSTGNPSVNQTNPVLTAWYLDFYNPYLYNYKGYSGAPAMQMESLKLSEVTISGGYAQDDGSFDKEEKNYTLNKAITATEKQINVEFEIALPYTIPSDGKDQLVAMDEYELPASYTYFAIPKLDKDAFLVADITGWETLNLLAGSANIFFEGNYVGQTAINPAETGDTLRVSFGRDNKVVVKREQLKEFTAKKFIATNKKVTYAYEISVRNTKQQSIKVEVQDQIPVSNNSGITVEAEETSGANYDKESGKLTWKFDVNPAETKSTRLIYSVKYPKGKTIAGL